MVPENYKSFYFAGKNRCRKQSECCVFSNLLPSPWTSSSLWVPHRGLTHTVALKRCLTANPLRVVTFLYTSSQPCSAFGVSRCKFDYFCLNVNSRRRSSVSSQRAAPPVWLLQQFKTCLLFLFFCCWFFDCFFIVFLRCDWLIVAPQNTNLLVFTACLLLMAALSIYLLVNQSAIVYMAPFIINPWQTKCFALWLTHICKKKKKKKGKARKQHRYIMRIYDILNTS